MLLIGKERTLPLRIQMNDALLRRLPVKHKKRKLIEADQANREAGFHGEQTADFFLNPLPADDYHVVNGLRLIIDHSPFQMDTLLITPNYSLIIEVKNLSGKIIYDAANDQFIQMKDGVEKRIRNPMAQVYRQRFLLGKWFHQHNFPPAPMECLVVNSNQNTIFKMEPENHDIFKGIIHAESLMKRIHNIHAGRKKVFRAIVEMKEVTKKLEASNTPLHVDLLKEYDISYNELIKGVRCPGCRRFPMVRGYGTWYCKSCQTRSKTAHEQAFDDYFLLVKPSITNRECRDFLLISSRHTAKRLLESQNLNSSGKYKKRNYYRI